MATDKQYDILFDEATIAQRMDAMGEELARDIGDSWTLIALLQGAMPFAVDLMRALAKRGINPSLDSLWLESYRDARESAGRVVGRADLSRSVQGSRALILDDVFDTGRTIAFAKAHLMAKGALEARACAAVRKPPALGFPIEYVGFDAPNDFLIGYGMDDAGRYRGLPFIARV